MKQISRYGCCRQQGAVTLAGTVILNYIHEKGELNLNELRDGAHVYAYWNGNPRTIIDSANRTVTIYKPVKGIVVLNSDAGEAVKILGVSDKVVGIVDTIEEKPFYFPDMFEKTVVGTWEEIRWEKIVDLSSLIPTSWTSFPMYSFSSPKP